MNQTMLYKLEKRNPSFLVTESEDKNIFYVTSKEDDRIAVVVTKGTEFRHVMMLTREQARILSEELPELTWMIGRGQVKEHKPRGKGFGKEK